MDNRVVACWLGFVLMAAATSVLPSGATAEAASVVIRPLVPTACKSGRLVLPGGSGRGEQAADALRREARSDAHYLIGQDGTVYEIRRPAAAQALSIVLVNPAEGGSFAEAQLIALALLIDEVASGASLHAAWSDAPCASGPDSLPAFDWAGFLERLALLSG